MSSELGSVIHVTTPVTARGPVNLTTIEILEQPSSNKIRFRYVSEIMECRSSGSKILGANSTASRLSYPTVRINNYLGPATILASCVTEENKVHPHHLIGKHCEDGVFTLCCDVTEKCNEFQLKKVAVQCVKVKEVAPSLRRRAELKVDPFRKGFKHSIKNAELKEIRIAFEVYIPLNGGREFFVPSAVVTNVIKNKISKARPSCHCMLHDQVPQDTHHSSCNIGVPPSTATTQHSRLDPKLQSNLCHISEPHPSSTSPMHPEPLYIVQIRNLMQPSSSASSSDVQAKITVSPNVFNNIMLQTNCLRAADESKFPNTPVGSLPSFGAGASISSPRLPSDWQPPTTVGASNQNLAVINPPASPLPDLSTLNKLSEELQIMSM